MDTEKIIASLDRFGQMVPAVVANVTDADSRWKPPDGAWSILEIVSHLADEEEFDFRKRVELTLSDPTADWPPIDPEGWAVERRYNEGSLEAATQRFVSLRAESVVLLRSFDQPDWQRAYQHPRFGPITAGEIFAAWAAHDALHLRQIAKRLFQLTVRDAGEFSTRYAGEWND